MKVMNCKGAVDDDGSDDYDDGGDEEEEVEEIEDPKEYGDDDDDGDEEEGDDKEGDEEDEDDDEVEEVNPPNGAQVESVSDDDDEEEEEDEDDEGGDDSDDGDDDGEEEDMGTEYLVRPVGCTEDKEDASDFKPGKENGEDDFEPGDFKNSMMKVMQCMWISVCLHEQLEWQELHYPILHLIMEKLSFPDFIRSASVCSWWRQVQRTSPARLRRPRLPWLINKDTGLTETHTIFNHSGMSRDIDIPGTRLTTTIGSAYGWLLYEYQGGREYFLLNHITNSRIKLPGPLSVRSYSRVSHAVISMDPSTADLKTVIIMFMINNAFIFCRPTDSGWSTIETGEPYTAGPNFWADMVACNGKIHVLTQHGKFGCINVSHNNCVTVEWLINEDRGGMRWSERSYCRARFLVESLGDILLVLAYEDCSFKIYKADLERMTWIEVLDLGDRILFLGRCCSLSASDPELTCGEKIYMSYPGDYKKRMNEISAACTPEQADRLWTWKLTSIHSTWHWTLPSC